MAWEYNPELLIKILEEADFDAYEAGNITAVKEIDGINHQLYINPKGRVRYQYSILLSSENSSIEMLKKSFMSDREKRLIVNIIGQLDSIDELLSFIREVNAKIGEER